MSSLAHIINPYKATPNTEHDYTQPKVFDSIIAAAKNTTSQVSLYSVQYSEDVEVVPSAFNILPNLNRSIADIHKFAKPRKFPLIHDILKAAYTHTEAEYIIYTNTDILLMPFFYNAVQTYIQQGHDAFAINRRRISKTFLQEKNLNNIYAEIGKSHPGFDCFVFKKSLFEKFVLGNICVGVPFLEATLLYNLIAFSKNFKVFTDKHLTIHIGMEVMPKRDSEYHQYNKQEFFKQILPQLKPNIKVENLPYHELSITERLFKWGLNPAVFTFVNTELEAKNTLEKLRLIKDEIRFKWLQKD